MISRTLLHSLRVVLIFTVSFLSACNTDPADEENGTIGTGFYLRGIFASAQISSATVIEVKSSDGQRSQFALPASGEFSADIFPGTAPHLIRAQVNSDIALYGIVYSNSTRNINSFTDVALRRVFAQNNLNVDDEFDAQGSIAGLPTEVAYNVAVASIRDLIDLAVSSYGISIDDVITTLYEQNDTGVDNFLRRNFVVIENNQVTFQITDPITNSRSETTSPTDIASASIDNGTPPTVPGSVRALSGDNRDVILLWEPSVDDSTVAAYAIFRDASLIGTTPYPQFIDDTAVLNRASTYIVTALDGAGNGSGPAPAVTGIALDNLADFEPPTPPTQVTELSSSSSAIRLVWSQQQSDVARYNLFRNEGQGTPTELLTTTSRRATDTLIEPNQLYCYQVSAVDAANNESERSDTTCITASDDMTSIVIDPTMPPMETGGDFNVPDASSADCPLSLSTADLMPGQNDITQGCYVISEMLVIPSGSTLQISQGVIFEFESDVGIRMNAGATLTVLGTRNNPVLFTGTVQVPGHWAGIEFTGNSVGNALVGAVVEYAGSALNQSAVSLGFENTSLRMQDTLIQFTQGGAISFQRTNANISSFTGNTFTNNTDLGVVRSTVLESLRGVNQYSGNNDDRFFSNFISIEDQQVTIPNLGVPITWGGIELSNGSLEIEPGVEIAMIANAQIIVDGAFSAQGTSTQPILIGDRTGTSGSWGGLVLQGASTKTINNLNLDSAGFSGLDTGAITVLCNPSNPFTVSVSNTNISGSLSWGIFGDGAGCDFRLAPSNTFSNNVNGDINLP